MLSHCRIGALFCTIVGVAACAVARELSNVEPISFTAASIAGTVIDSITQAPLIGAELLLLNPNGDSIRDQQARAYSYAPDGTFRFGSVRPGSYLLRADLEGYHAVTVPLQGLEAGHRRSVSVKLKRR